MSPNPHPSVFQESIIRPSLAKDRLIVALDFPTASLAFDMIEKLDQQCRWFKVGLELYIAAGPMIVTTLVERGYSVFLDLKLHDIPNTVASAVRAAASLGASLLTVHASGGPAMLKAAQQAALALPSAPQLLAVTVLTSMDQQEVTAIGVQRSPAEQVLFLAQMGLSAGISGFVCSPREVASVRALTSRELTEGAGVLVIPGIRPEGAATGDQQRIATPAHALRMGASYLVVGRPITQAGDPAAAAAAILAEMNACLASGPLFL